MAQAASGPGGVAVVLVTDTRSHGSYGGIELWAHYGTTDSELRRAVWAGGRERRSDASSAVILPCRLGSVGPWCGRDAGEKVRFLHL